MKYLTNDLKIGTIIRGDGINNNDSCDAIIFMHEKLYPSMPIGNNTYIDLINGILLALELNNLITSDEIEFIIELIKSQTVDNIIIAISVLESKVFN